MNFTISGFRRESGEWGVSVSVPNGQTVTGADVEDLLFAGLVHYRANRDVRIPTLIECAALALPEGWAATSDGVNTHTTIGHGTVYSRNYQRGDQVVEAVCDVDGNPTADTREFLLLVPNA